MVGLKHGLGSTISLLQADEAAIASKVSIARHPEAPSLMLISIKSAYAAQILFIASLCLSKCSTLWLMMRLFNLNSTKVNNGANSKLYFTIGLGILGVMGVWGLGSILGLSIDCSASHFIRTPSLSLCPQQVQ
jgi:hypothetical protein